MSATSQPQSDPAASLLADYRPLPGIADELIDAQGNLRPVWRSFIAGIGGMSAEELQRRFETGDQYLRDAGVFFRQYEETGSSDRSWPLSHIPVLIHESEWATISDGLIQRAELLESVCADLYGEARLVQEGHLPANLIAMSPEWLRPMVGVRPRSGHFLNFIAFEIGRGPDGQWWVLGDRVQAPSGAGFALENRIATTRVFPDLYASSNVHRLAGFFRAFRDALHDLRGDSDSRVGILTPGRLNDTYFEHAYIARYLGFMLLEGEDLTVENGRVMVRTIAGLSPVSVLWRRIDASFADPLELNENSRLGTPGLVEAIRRGKLAMVNALGSGILEMRALLAFLPRISQALLQEPLKLPNIATWWCGQETERNHVRANAHRMMIASALSTRMPFDPEGSTMLGSNLQSEPGGLVDVLLDKEAELLVGQEAVTLSTSPAWIDGKLTPRPMSLRVFLARTSRGWRVMPGGYGRIGRTQDASAIALQRGGSVSDVWVVSDKPVRNETMLPSPTSPYVRSQLPDLPSRAADNLFWMGRYVERAEGLIRLLRSIHVRIAEAGHADTPLIEHARAYPGFFGFDPATGAPQDLLDALASATASASVVRDRFSVDGWTALNDLSSAGRTLSALTPGDASTRALGGLLRQITGFSGLVHDNMYRFAGWRFLSIGRSLERASAMAQLLAHFAAPDSPDGALDLVVEVGDSVLSHRRLYAVATTRPTVIDLLACDANNPRSIHYHLAEIDAQVGFLPGAKDGNQLSTLASTTFKMRADLAVKRPEQLDSAALLQTGLDIGALSELLTNTYLR
ncbi:MAG TPA: circularly permuted type 2 ATP-grasp protein [Hyphomonadaceae bacterium]|nr:circularly permuted type 2 ATP-grasp protein [Hyphomonadaceae bacterium]